MNQLNIKELLDKFKRKPNDVVGIDIGSTSIKIVRMKKISETETIITAVDVIPPPVIQVTEPLAPAAAPVGKKEQTDTVAALPTFNVTPIELPARIRGKYAAFTVTGNSAVVKLVSLPGAFDAAAEEKVISSLGLDDPNLYRIGYKILVEGHGKNETKVLAVALPERDAIIAPMLTPAGLPAPFSIEVAGLATLTSFMTTAAIQHAEEAIGVLEFETTTTTYAIFNKGVLSLIRRFDFGTATIIEKVQEALGVDQETAQGIIADGAFDISQAISDVMDPFIKQLTVSKDFIERRENCHVLKMYIAGGLVVSRDAIAELNSAMGIEILTWNPFAGLNMAPDAMDEKFKGQEWRFAAALGACLATFEET